MPNALRLTAATLAGALFVAAACHTIDVPTAAGEPTVTADVVEGIGQAGNPGDTLNDPIVVRVHDRRDRPFVNTPIEWFADGGGRLIDVATRTDSLGNATARWVMGSGKELQRIRVRPLRGIEKSATASILRPPASGPGELRVLSLPTYDGSGEVVHPDVISASTPLRASPFLMAVTPYPNGNSKLENPSVLSSGDGLSWVIPPGASNPLVTPPVVGAYLSDPDLVYDRESRSFWLFYREVQGRANVIHAATSRDGVKWETKYAVVTSEMHALVSPAVVRRAKSWMMWTVNAGTEGCSSQTSQVDLRTSSDGINWSDPTPVVLPSPIGTPWHIDVQWIRARQEYWAIYNVKTAGNCGTRSVYLATSPDGIQWTTLPTPAIEAGAIPEFRDIVYRASVQYVPAQDAVALWFSGASSSSGRYVWHVAVQQQSRAALFAKLSAPHVINARATMRPLVAFTER